MARPSFFHLDIPAVGGKVSLDERESHHAGASRRLRVGDEISLLDGAGLIADATIEIVTKDQLTATIFSRNLIPAPARTVHVACALPKGDRQRNLLDMLSQIGISSFTPLLCERSMVKAKSINLDRLHRIAVEACKQSQNPYLPETRAPVGVADILRTASGPDSCCVLAHRDGAEFKVPAQTQVTVLVGPEGGFTEAELELILNAGALAFNLSDNILRIETAAVIAAGLLLGA